MDLDSNRLRPDIDETPDGGVRLVEEFGFEQLSGVADG